MAKNTSNYYLVENLDNLLYHMIRKVKPEDASGIISIYNHYVLHTDITFETEEVTISEMSQRILDISGHYPYLVYEESGAILGYCYASLWKKRKAYQHSVESTVYVSPSAHSRGIGQVLMNALLEELKQLPIHTIIACIALPNPPSIKLHEKLGFRQVSCFREVGFKFNKWIDVGDWELLL